MLAKTIENDQLLQIQRQYPDILTLPGYQERGYRINLTTRLIETPEFLSVEKDHNSEVKYFVLGRYFDHKDLSTAVCIIQYKNAIGEEFIYPVPFFDTYTLRTTNEMIIPWNISGEATAYAGQITYSFRFYEFETLKDEAGNIIRDEDGNITYGDLIYNLNTLPATSKILHGLDVNLPEVDKLKYDKDAYETLVSMINDDSRKVIYWNIID